MKLNPIWSSAESEPQTQSAIARSLLLYAVFLLSLVSISSRAPIVHEYPALQKPEDSFSTQGMQLSQRIVGGRLQWSLFRSVVETPKSSFYSANARYQELVCSEEMPVLDSDDVVKLRRCSELNRRLGGIATRL